MAVPAKYRYLLGNTPATMPPIMVRAALDLLGTFEFKGAPNNPKILAWADEVAQVAPSAYNRWAAGWYEDDSIPWCGLFQAVVATRTWQGRPERLPPDKYLAALSWRNWGVHVDKANAMLGDTVVYQRKGGGHVGQYVGEDRTHIYTLGGNQGDAVTIAPIAKADLVAVRRPPYLVQPLSVRKIFLSPSGEVTPTLA